VHQEGALREKNAPEPAPDKIKIVVFGDFGLTEGPRYQGIAHAKRRLADEVFNAKFAARAAFADRQGLAMGRKL
jgi:hypothetical protein